MSYTEIEMKVLDVPCQACEAPAGFKCWTPSGRVRTPHAIRATDHYRLIKLLEAHPEWTSTYEALQALPRP